MDCGDLIKSWIIPKNVTECSCWVISSQQKISLYPLIVNEIVIRFKGTAPTNLLQINNHMTNKPWRIVNEYIYFNQNTHSLTIPIVTDVHHILSIGEPIDEDEDKKIEDINRGTNTSSFKGENIKRYY